MTEADEYISLSGCVDTVIYKNEDNGYTVITLETEDDYITAVGELGDIQAGEEVTLHGSYTTHSKYGSQFNAKIAERKLPSTASAIKKYLASGIVKGIGPGMAKRIVEKFGEDTLLIIENSPERLCEVKGISESMQEKIAEEFKQVFGIRTVMLQLGKYGIAPLYCVNAWKRWGTDTLAVIEDNPYMLCVQGVDMDFNEVDSFADKISSDQRPLCRLKAGLAYILTVNTQSGHTCLPKDKLFKKAKELFDIDEQTFEMAIAEEEQDLNLCVYTKKSRDFVYLTDYFKAERYIAERISLLKRSFPHFNKDFEELINKSEKRDHIKYEKLQREAISQALSSGTLILTGGPGTGKTTTLNAIISILKDKGENVLISAPTGRAAKRISELTGYDAKTIHRMLEASNTDNQSLKFLRNEDKPLLCSTLIIDEMSMVDVLLFEAILRALPLSARIILVGDSDQLPSVGAGNVLKDLIDSNCVACVELKEIFRQATESAIVENSHKIINGIMPDLSIKDKDFFFMKRSNEASVINTVLELCCKRLPTTYGFSPLSDIQVLTPMRKGLMGTVALNAKLQNQLNSFSEEKNEITYMDYIFRQGDKVMQIKNNYDLIWSKGHERGAGVYNGDIGTVMSVDVLGKTITVDFDGKLITYPYDLLKELELAYAVTVHKSQGSEFEAVILPLFSGYQRLFYRSLLYTAVTRAKKILIIVGSEDTVFYMVKQDRKTLRYSCLKVLIQGYCDYEDA